jgi:phosphatidylcholine synthase
MTVLWAAMTLSLIVNSRDRAAPDLIDRIELWLWLAASAYFAWISLWRTFVRGNPEPHDHEGEQ